MNRNLLFILTCLLVFASNAQENTKKPTPPMRSTGIASLDQFAIYPGCEDQAEMSKQQKCFTEAISEHIINNFNTDIAKKLELAGTMKLYAAFVIGEDAIIREVRTRAPDPLLDKELKRVINLIPRMKKPATSKGKPIAVSFTLPVVISI